MKKRHLRPRRAKPPRKRGSQPGNQNAYKHGTYTRELLALRADIRAHIRRGQALITEFADIRDRIRGPKGRTTSRVQHEL